MHTLTPALPCSPYTSKIERAAKSFEVVLVHENASPEYRSKFNQVIQVGRGGQNQWGREGGGITALGLLLLLQLLLPLIHSDDCCYCHRHIHTVTTAATATASDTLSSLLLLLLLTLLPMC